MRVMVIWNRTWHLCLMKIIMLSNPLRRHGRNTIAKIDKALFIYAFNKDQKAKLDEKSDGMRQSGRIHGAKKAVIRILKSKL